ncbi:MAG: T9SS type A sorting domain-containing protein [Chitinophagales bacterium]
MKNIYKPALLVLVFSCSLFTLLHSQPVIEWQKTIGGSYEDKLTSIQQTADGGYILGGYSFSGISGDKTENSNGGDDYWVVKTDAAGNIQWQNTIGGDGIDELESIQQTTDGGYILGGYSESDISGDKTEDHGFTVLDQKDYWLIKIDAAGNIQWQNTIGGDGGDVLQSVQQTTDGGYILGGYSSANISYDKTENPMGGSDYWIVKTDALGNIQWQNTIGSSGAEELHSVQQTTDGGYILGGFSGSNISGDKTDNCNGGWDYWIVKTDAAGNIQWQNTIGGGLEDRLSSIQQTSDGGYILGGISISNISGDKTENNTDTITYTDDYWIVKTDSLGNILWENTIGGEGNDELKSVQQTTDGGYILGGYSESDISGDKTENSIGNGDYWVVKIDAAGSIQWQNTIGGSEYDDLSSIQQTADGGYILGGLSTSNISGDKTENCNGTWDYWIVKLTGENNAVTGNLFADLNSNTVRDAGEPLLINKKVTEQNTGRFAFSEQNGHYSVSVLDTGNYTVAPAPISYYNAVPATQSAYFTGLHQTDSLNHFAFQPVGVVNDVCVTLTPRSAFRVGFDAQYVITFENTGNTILSGSVVFYPDSALSYVSSSITPAYVNTDSVVWNYTSLAPFESASIWLTVHVNSSTPIGSSINSNVRIDPVAGDATPACNYARWQVLTTGSYDPNDILVDEDTLTTTELVAYPFLEYIIRFQNTGNDTAFTIKVLNPIDTAKLDINTIEFVSSSHPVNLKWLDNKQNMEFTFNNILLPDSNTNELLSHGFVRYRIQPKTNLVAGNIIPNSAGIYFDFNQAVLTNTATTSIVLLSDIKPFSPQHLSFGIYPNPASSSITIAVDKSMIGSNAIVTDITGRMIAAVQLTSTNTTLNTSGFARGVYLVKVQLPDETVTVRKFVVE